MTRRILADLSPADRIRYQLMLCGLSQRSGARELGIDDRTMRHYCAGKPVPRFIDYAMQYLVIRAARARRQEKHLTRTETGYGVED